jgi:hypothetical protein
MKFNTGCTNPVSHLPEGEGVCGTAVGQSAFFTIILVGLLCVTPAGPPFPLSRRYPFDRLPE